MKIRSVRGTHDIFGADIDKYNEIFEAVSFCAKLSNFQQLNTPIFEFSELFAKPLGEQSDVVLKEMYTFNDRNNDSLTLRPEYTTPVIRAAITNNLLNELPFKVFGIGPMFRRERPQKGRFREFNQINFEILGSDNVISDIELISIANDILKKILPNKKITLNINSLGTKENLLLFKKQLGKFYKDNKNKLSEESKGKILSNPLRILDSKNEDDILISESAPSINEFLSKETKDHFSELKNSLNSLNINFIENYKLVRGLDYYCSTVFEFKTSDLGSQDTILGGGRYDGLVNLLGGPDIPGIGWAAGVERISLLMNDVLNKKNNIHLAILNKKFNSKLINIIQYLKKYNLNYFWNYKYNLKKSLSKASQDNSKFIIIIGEAEFEGDFYTVKNLFNSNQVKLKIDKIWDYINDQS